MMKKLLLLIMICVFGSYVELKAATAECIIDLNTPITFTHTRVRVTYGDLLCPDLPNDAIITDVFQSFLVTNITSLGDIDVRLTDGSSNFNIVRTISGVAPVVPISAGAAGHSSAFNGLNASTPLTLSAIFTDPSTSTNGFPLSSPMQDYQFVLTYEYSALPPEADFSYSSTGRSVSFQNTSSGGDGVLTYLWDFGDGSTSTLASPTHGYANDLTYNVVLTVTDESGASSSTNESIAIDSLVVNFSHNDTDLVVSFQDTSTGGLAPFSYDWQFGDGTNSNLENPTHTYTSAGTYNVKLNKTGANGVVRSITTSITVTVTPPPSLALDITFARYEFANCTGFVRGGFVEWSNIADATSYELQEKSGATYFTVYSGTSYGAYYSKTAFASKTYNLRVRAINGTTLGDWRNFNAYVPKCGSGGPNPF